jgi:hypothetical protein
MIGTALAGTAIAGISAIVGFFLGAIFLVLAFVLLRAPRREPST